MLAGRTQGQARRFARFALALTCASTGMLPGTTGPATAWAAGVEASSASAAKHPPNRTTATGKPAKLSKATFDKLRSASDADVGAALDELRALGPSAAAAAPAVATVLDRGAHRDITVSALTTLGALGAAETVASIVPYSGHRDLAIRHAAVDALGQPGIRRGEGALIALRRALGDPDETIRAAAALGLATPDAAPLASDLVRALDHKVANAGAALGVTCAGDVCIELAARMGTFPDEAAAGLDRVFARGDLDDDVKSRVLEKIGSLHSQRARTYLAGLATRWPSTASAALTRARDAALSTASGVR